MATRVQRRSADNYVNLQSNPGLSFTIGGLATIALDTSAFAAVGRTRYFLFFYSDAGFSGSWSNVSTSLTGTRYSRVEGYGTLAGTLNRTYYYVVVS